MIFQRDGGFDHRLVSQLLHNYRSLPSILAAYSEMSYDSKLIANISDEDSDEQRLLAKVKVKIDPSLKLEHTPKYGVYFIGKIGRDETVSDSTSWRNHMEVQEVKIIIEFFRLLLSSLNSKLSYVIFIGSGAVSS